MKKGSISKLIIAYAVFQVVVVIFFGIFAITGRAAPELVGREGANLVFGTIAVRNFAIAILLLIGIIHKNPAILLGGFVVRFAMDIGDYIVRVFASGAPAPRLIVALIILLVVLWVPQVLCIRALKKQVHSN